MGWTGHQLSEGGKLWTRGGLSGVQVEKDGAKINVDESLLLALAAEHIRSQRISELEQASASGIFGFSVPEHDWDRNSR